MSDRPTPAPRAPEAERPTGPTDDDLRPYFWAPGDYTFPCRDCGKWGEGDKRCCRPCAVIRWQNDRLKPAAPKPPPIDWESRARAAEEDLERVRDLTRAAMAYGDAGTTQRINALHRAAKAYYARRAGSQGEERT